MGWFSRGIDIEHGIIDPEGYFRTARRPQLGGPLAEIYALSERGDAPGEWRLQEQERLSHVPRWGDDYFQHWAEILGFGGALGDIAVQAAWVIVAFDARGEPVACVEYRPIVDGDSMDDVGYCDAGWRLDSPA
jgi:hypothetical protein